LKEASGLDSGVAIAAMRADQAVHLDVELRVAATGIPVVMPLTAWPLNRHAAHQNKTLARPDKTGIAAHPISIKADR
jgi:hypothetical protein